MKKIIKKVLNVFGIEVRRVTTNNYYKSQTMVTGMENAFLRGLGPISTIIDVGAAEGSWSLLAKKIWTDPTYLLFEPLKERQSALKEIIEKNPKFYHIPKAAGEKKGHINFYVSDDLDGSGISEDAKEANNVRQIEVSSLDEEVERLNLKGPYIVKLDTHGFEVPIIEGCNKILNDISLFIIECYGFQIAENSLLFGEMCQYMDKKGFRLVNIVDIMNRPKDNTFWQCDAFFIPKDSDVFTTNTFN